MKNLDCKRDISIIIPLYRGKKYCNRLLYMLQNNCRYHDLYKKCDIEVIFVNDYPEEEIIFTTYYREFEIITIVNEKNAGIHSSRVKGFMHSCGKYIIFFDQDDRITDDWLYEQYENCVERDCDACVCNGWLNRFKLIRTQENKLNNADHYLSIGNVIISPGQVILKKECIPDEWLKNIQKINGADDYLLWIMFLKKGHRFSYNDKNLYYHSPERTNDSIGDENMIKSLKESMRILGKERFLTVDEKEKLTQQIAFRADKLNIERKEKNGDFEKVIPDKSGLKFKKMFFIMYEWMMCKEQGSNIGSFLISRGYSKVAIYGMGYIGQCLYYELLNAGLQIPFAIDRFAVDFEQKVRVIRKEDDFDKADLIIITFTENVEEEIDFLRKKAKCKVMTIDSLLRHLISAEEKYI